MKRWVLGILFSAGVIGYIAPAMAGGIFADLRNDIDKSCVLHCLEASNECKAADRIRCQESCKKPIDVIEVVGNTVVRNPGQPDMDKCAQYPQRCYDAELNVLENLNYSLFGQNNQDFRTYVPVVTTFTDNPFEDLGISLPLSKFIHFLPVGVDLPNFEGTESTPYVDNIGCNWGKEALLPGGSQPFGCRETAAFGTDGWAAKGCKASYGCCWKPGGPDLPAGQAGVMGYGVCSINSTRPGTGFYNDSY